MAEPAVDGQPRVLALFQRRIAGDDALLRLARLRFEQAGLGAEVYAHDPGELEWVLGFVPPFGRLPVVHLDRKLNVLRTRDTDTVIEFAARFAGRASGLVVHDQPEMAARTDDLVSTLDSLAKRLNGMPGAPTVFLEYAAGHELAWFVDLGARLKDLDGVGLCIDVGHVGIRHARRCFAQQHPDLELAALGPHDARLADVVHDVDRAVGRSLPAVLEVTQSLGALGVPLHFHLHDGHPLAPGLSDHFSFLFRLPIPFEHNGRRSLPPMYGPQGLAAIVSSATAACVGCDPVFTLEIHQAEGRVPLDNARELFGHWRDLTNAERMNYWLSVLSDNASLAMSALN